MSEQNQERIAELVEELDSLVPKEDACFTFALYVGGAHEDDDEGDEMKEQSFAIGNPRGYIRFGIEMLRAAHDELDDSPNHLTFSKKLKYLRADLPKRAWFPEWFERHDERTIIEKELAPYPKKGTSYLAGMGCAFILIACLLSMFLGFWIIFQWIFK